MAQEHPAKLPSFHPAIHIRSLIEGEPDFTVSDFTLHGVVLNETGSGKTSAIARQAAQMARNRGGEERADNARGGLGPWNRH